jgi:hypothetical protein
VATKPVMIRLDDADYARLEHEAQHLGLRPGTLAKILLHSSLKTANRSREATQRRRLEALAQLQALAHGVPPVDPVRLVEQGRLELERRLEPQAD